MHHTPANTPSPNDTRTPEAYQSISVTAQLSLEDDGLSAINGNDHNIDKSGNTLYRKDCDKGSKSSDTQSQYTTQRDFVDNRASNDTRVDMTPAAATPLLPEQALDICDNSSGRFDNENTFNLGISTDNLLDNMPIFPAKSIETRLNMTDIDLAANHENESNESSPNSAENIAG